MTSVQDEKELGESSFQQMIENYSEAGELLIKSDPRTRRVQRVTDQLIAAIQDSDDMPYGAPRVKLDRFRLLQRALRPQGRISSSSRLSSWTTTRATRSVFRVRVHSRRQV